MGNALGLTRALRGDGRRGKACGSEGTPPPAEPRPHAEPRPMQSPAPRPSGPAPTAQGPCLAWEPGPPSGSNQSREKAASLGPHSSHDLPQLPHSPLRLARWVNTGPCPGDPRLGGPLRGSETRPRQGMPGTCPVSPAQQPLLQHLGLLLCPRPTLPPPRDHKEEEGGTRTKQGHRGTLEEVVEGEGQGLRERPASWSRRPSKSRTLEA